MKHVVGCTSRGCVPMFCYVWVLGGTCSGQTLWFMPLANFGALKYDKNTTQGRYYNDKTFLLAEIKKIYFFASNEDKYTKHLYNWLGNIEEE